MVIHGVLNAFPKLSIASQGQGRHCIMLGQLMMKMLVELSQQSGMGSKHSLGELK